MDAEAITLKKLLDGNRRFRVPVYQRTYEWTVAEQIQILVEQIRSKADDRIYAKEAKILPHYIGALILQPDTNKRVQFDSSSQQLLFDIVDGQQRIVTTQIYLTALKEVARNFKFYAVADNISKYLINNDYSDVRRYKVLSSRKDRDVFCDLIDLSYDEVKIKYDDVLKNKEKKKTDASYALLAYLYVYENSMAYVTEDQEIKPEVRLVELSLALLENLNLIAITLDPENDDAQVIFQTLNSGGKPLAVMDLIRNDIFHRALKDQEDIDSLHRNKWSLLETDFWTQDDTQGRIKKRRIDFFLADVLSSETGKYAPISELYARYKNFSKEANFENVASELQLLLDHGKNYRILCETNTDGSLANIGNFLKIFDSKTAYPLVMTIAKSQASETEKSEMYKIIINYLVRRTLCENLTIKAYNLNFIKFNSDLKKNGVSKQSLIDTLHASNSDTSRFPTDIELKNAINQRKQYKAGMQAKLKWILMQIENSLHNEDFETVLLQGNLSIEHIMPQKWEENWPLSDGTKVSSLNIRYELSSKQMLEYETRNKLVHCLGNLTLLTPTANAKLSNNDFWEKKDRLKSSNLIMNRTIGNEKESWDVSDIEQRCSWMAERIINIWPRLI